MKPPLPHLGCSWIPSCCGSNAQPFSVAARLKRIEPVLETAARLTARLEKSRLVVSHAINLSVLKAGI